MKERLPFLKRDQLKYVDKSVSMKEQSLYENRAQFSTLGNKCVQILPEVLVCIQYICASPSICQTLHYSYITSKIKFLMVYITSKIKFIMDYITSKIKFLMDYITSKIKYSWL